MPALQQKAHPQNLDSKSLSARTVSIRLFAQVFLNGLRAGNFAFNHDFVIDSHGRGP
jgi:hypothetical protein